MLSSFDQRRVYEAAVEYEVEFKKEEIRHRQELEHQFRIRMIDIEFQQRKMRYLLELRDGMACQVASINNLLEELKGV